MIEVERQYEPTSEQYASLLEGAEFLGEVKNHDIYYDYPDFKFFKNKIKLRNRNGRFEIKQKISNNIVREIENEEEIKSFLGITKDLQSFAKEDLIVFLEYTTTRQKYKKEGFIIDVDETDFGMKSCDIEIMVETEELAEKAEEKLNDFAQKYNLVSRKILSKRATYLKLFKPEVYNELYVDK